MEEAENNTPKKENSEEEDVNDDSDDSDSDDTTEQDEARVRELEKEVRHRHNAQFNSSVAAQALAFDSISYTAPKRVLHTLTCLLYTSPSPRDFCRSRMPSSA